MTSSSVNSAILRAQAVTRQVNYHGQQLAILHDASLDVAAGESVAIVGASGSGKSTLLAILAGLDAASSGEVWLAGQPLSGLDEDGRALLRREQVGFVFQNFQLMPQFTALENVMLPLELAGRAEDDALRAAMLQRVAAARADMQALGAQGVPQLAVGDAATGRRRVLGGQALYGNFDALLQQVTQA